MPIRNLIMAAISTVSIYEHIRNYKLPLPDIIDLDFVLHHQYLTKRIRQHLQKIQHERWAVLFELLLDICIYLEKDAKEYVEIIQKDLWDYSCLSPQSPRIEINNFAEDVKLMYLDLYTELDEEFFKKFFDSDEFKDIIIDYC